MSKIGWENTRKILIFLILGCLTASCNSACDATATPQKNHDTQLINEKEKLLNSSYYGDFSKARIEKISGKITLKVWEPHIKYSNTLPPSMRSTMLEGVQELPIEYDEIWEAEYDKFLSPAQKEQLKDQLDITAIYWKRNQVQAITLQKFYLTDPLTGKKLSPPSHKLVNIDNRSLVLANLREK